MGEITKWTAWFAEQPLLLLVSFETLLAILMLLMFKLLWTT